MTSSLIPHPSSLHKGFTLVELLVVIAIIAILAGVLFATFGTGTESARAAKCLANMRNLAQGALSVAAKNSSGWYPFAGSHAWIGMSSEGKTQYGENVGWISWLSKNDEYSTRSRRKKKPTSFVNLENVSAYCKDDEDATFAITNGSLWKAVGQNRETYVCPEHKRRAGRKGATVRWSYVMSAYFGYDSTKGSDAAVSEDGGGVSLRTPRLDRRLLFAELPTEEEDYPSGNGDPKTDCVLQYKASVNGKGYNTDWSGTAEKIGFNHTSGKRKCAHVIFADGHAEKLLMPRGSSGLNDEQLTAVLCGGVDVGFDGSAYTVIKDGDEN